MVRRYKVFLFCVGVQVLLLGLLFAHASYRQKMEGASLKEKVQLISKLGLTDLCLFTEANYTRHLSQSDLHTPFQDHPSSFDHFPSGSLLGPPQIIERMNGKLD